jgi:hypothetical protein
MAASAAAHAAPGWPLLDPVENKSVKPARDGGEFDAQSVTQHERGKYRRQYETHAAVTAWGTEKQGCGSGALVRQVEDQIQVMPVLCDMWRCKLCGPKRVAWLKRELHQAMFRHKLRYFWTLTIWTETCTPIDSYKLVTDSWNIVRRNLSRDYGKFSYVWVMESTRRGYAHLHLLTSVAVPHAEISRRWAAATGGSFVVDVQSAASERAANYLAKYCTQQATARREDPTGKLWHRHVFGKSRDIAFEPFRTPSADDGEWYHWKRPYKDALELLGDLAVLEVNKTDRTPYAVLRASERLNLPAECERLGAALDQARADDERWPEPEEIEDGYAC